MSNSITTILVTGGDPGGIGPEIAAKAGRAWHRPDDCRLIILGAPAHFGPHWTADEPLPPFKPIDELMKGSTQPGLFWACPGPEALDGVPELGGPSVQGGHAAARCLEVAIKYCLEKKAEAICTAPISKEGMRAAGYTFPGHTELLADRCEADLVAMMLVGGGLRVVLATIHEPISRVPQLITPEMLKKLFRLVHRSMPDFDIEEPRIGVAGLNPHCGEGGLFGSEETSRIEPAIQAAQAQGLRVTGPWSADTLFHRMLEGEFDVVVAMYHDQGLVPIKTLDFHGGVNITLGLPFIRTSPDHGTAYAIAGRGIARSDSMLAALDQAYQLVRGRR